MHIIEPESFLITAMSYQMLNEIKWSTNMILKSFSLKRVIMITGLKMENCFVQQGNGIKKNRVIKQKLMKKPTLPLAGGEEESKRGKAGTNKNWKHLIKLKK